MYAGGANCNTDNLDPDEMVLLVKELPWQLSIGKLN
jgi:hypothetical protein